MTTARPDEMLLLKGFKVEITGADGGKSEDNAWETCTGGALCIEVADSSTGSDKFQTTSPGHKSIEEITLRGPMTAGRKWIAQNINDTVAGKSRFDLTIVEIKRDGSDGRRFNYTKCFITRYVYPVLSAGGTGDLYEEVSLKPERLALA